MECVTVANLTAVFIEPHSDAYYYKGNIDQLFDDDEKGESREPELCERMWYASHGYTLDIVAPVDAPAFLLLRIQSEDGSAEFYNAKLINSFWLTNRKL